MNVEQATRIAGHAAVDAARTVSNAAAHSGALAGRFADTFAANEDAVYAAAVSAAKGAYDIAAANVRAFEAALNTYFGAVEVAHYDDKHAAIYSVLAATFNEALYSR